MRYEAKHNYLKKLGQNIGNYINISWTLAMRHQYSMLLQHYRKQFDEKTEIGPSIFMQNFLVVTL